LPRPNHHLFWAPQTTQSWRPVVLFRSPRPNPDQHR
jgi:hypothetical protein